MNFETFGFYIRQGAGNLRRNRLFSLASAVTIAACIFLFSLMYSILVNLEYMAEEAEGTVGINVFFEEGLTDEEIETIGNTIRSNGLVDHLDYTSADDAWEHFKDKYFADDPELAEGFADDNPLADSASYTVYLKDPSRQADALRWLEGISGVRKATYSELAANGLRNLRSLVGLGAGFLITILLVISLFLISNTTSLAYSVRKNEIEVMKYIGATNAFVRAPFLVEGMIIGLVGAAIPLAGVYVLYRVGTAEILKRFAVLSDVITFLEPGRVFAVLIPVALALGLGIGLAGSFFTIRKELRV